MEITLPTTVEQIGSVRISRQAMRRLGYYQILLQLKREFSLIPRDRVREVARQLNKRAWDGRDKEAVRKLIHG